MSTKYKAIITTATEHKVVEANTPAALGAAIGAVIAADPRNDVEVVYDVRGPLSRRMGTDEKP